MDCTWGKHGCWDARPRRRSRRFLKGTDKWWGVCFGGVETEWHPTLRIWGWRSQVPIFCLDRPNNPTGEIGPAGGQKLRGGASLIFPQSFCCETSCAWACQTQSLPSSHSSQSLAYLPLILRRQVPINTLYRYRLFYLASRRVATSSDVALLAHPTRCAN